jgi:hypothetical protein
MKRPCQALLCLLIGLATHSSPAGDYIRDFARKGIDKQVMKLSGSCAAEAITEDSLGILVRIPLKESGHASAGVISKFKVGGDFEITAAYELIEVNRPKNGYGAGVGLRIVKSSGDARRATLARFQHPKSGSGYTTDVAVMENEKLKHESTSVPTETRKGRLRLVRRGPALQFLVAEGENDSFREVRQAEFGSEELSSVELYGDTGGAQLPVSVRLISLAVTADDLPLGAPQKQERAIWSIWSIFGAAGVLLLVASGVYYFWRARKRE